MTRFLFLIFFSLPFIGSALPVEFVSLFKIKQTNDTTFEFSAHRYDFGQNTEDNTTLFYADSIISLIVNEELNKVTIWTNRGIIIASEGPPFWEKYVFDDTYASLGRIYNLKTSYYGIAYQKEDRKNAPIFLNNQRITSIEKYNFNDFSLMYNNIIFSVHNDSTQQFLSYYDYNEEIDTLNSFHSLSMYNKITPRNSDWIAFSNDINQTSIYNHTFNPSIDTINKSIINPTIVRREVYSNDSTYFISGDTLFSYSLQSKHLKSKLITVDEIRSINMIAGDYYDGKWENRTSFIVSKGESLYTAVDSPNNIFESIGHKDSTWAQLTFNFITDLPSKKSTKNLFDVYPNPAINSIKLNTPLTLLNLQIFDSNGHLYNVSYNTDNLIDISSLPLGAYTIKATTTKSTIHSHFIKIE